MRLRVSGHIGLRADVGGGLDVRLDGLGAGVSQITTQDDTITVRLERRAYSPVLRKANLPADTRVPWWGGRTLPYEYQ